MSVPHFIQPAEWAPHSACWLAWPYQREYWRSEKLLNKAQEEFVALVYLIADPDPVTGKNRGEKINLLVANDEVYAQASSVFKGIEIAFYQYAYGDIWLRDTAPIFVLNAQGQLGSVSFSFNGWGQKFLYPGDEGVAHYIAQKIPQNNTVSDLILEGGSIETDGAGTLLSTKQCLLNPNRNPQLKDSQITSEVLKLYGAQKMLWLDYGLINDHTDGHIDTLARFTNVGQVVCMITQQEGDPNQATLLQIQNDLKSFTDCKNQPLKVHTIPSPGIVLDEEGDLMPASYCNFYIGNTCVVVPTYESPYDQAAVEALQLLFPHHKVLGSPAKGILSGGGAFHCITQQQPKAEVL